MSGARPWAHGALAHYVRRAGQDPAAALGQLPRLWSPRVLFTDPHHDRARAVLVAGSARSGTTWLAEVMAADHPLRLVFEPLRRDAVRAARALPRSYYAPPTRADPELTRLLDRVLAGRVRSLWSDNHNRCRRAQGRVVKEVRANNLLPFVVRHFPEVPVVYLLRHPLATAWSAADLGMAPELDQLAGQPRLLAALDHGPRAALEEAVAVPPENPVEPLVLRWCLEHVLPLSQLRGSQVHVLFYEDLVEAPEVELARLGAYLVARQRDLWESWHPGAPTLGRPSRTAWRQPAATATDRLEGWRRGLPASVVDRSLALLERCGLAHLYGEEARPLLAAADVLDRQP